MFFGCRSKVIGNIPKTSGQPLENIDRVISGHLRSGMSQKGGIRALFYDARMGLVSNNFFESKMCRKDN